MMRPPNMYNDDLASAKYLSWSKSTPGALRGRFSIPIISFKHNRASQSYSGNTYKLIEVRATESSVRIKRFQAPYVQDLHPFFANFPQARNTYFITLDVSDGNSRAARIHGMLDSMLMINFHSSLPLFSSGGAAS